MKQYLVSVYHPEENDFSTETMEAIFRDVDTLNGELQASGAWVFAGGLHPASTATVVRLDGGEVLTTDGPFAESREHLGGFYIVAAEDLDAALLWTSKTSAIIGAPIEIRPFQDEPGA